LPGKAEVETRRILKTFALFTYGDTHYVTKPVCENILKIATRYHRL